MQVASRSLPSIPDDHRGRWSVQGFPRSASPPPPTKPAPHSMPGGPNGGASESHPSPIRHAATSFLGAVQGTLSRCDHRPLEAVRTSERCRRVARNANGGTGATARGRVHEGGRGRSSRFETRTAGLQARDPPRTEGRRWPTSMTPAAEADAIGLEALPMFAGSTGWTRWLFLAARDGEPSGRCGLFGPSERRIRWSDRPPRVGPGRSLAVLAARDGSGRRVGMPAWSRRRPTLPFTRLLTTSASR